MITPGEGAVVSPSFYHTQGKYGGVLSWLLSTDHKRIGVMYLAAILSFFLVGVTLGILMRINLLAPGKFISQSAYNALFTVHGVIQIFLFIIPGIPASFGNFFLPILLGARDVAFPRINLMSLWFYLLGGIMIILSVFIGGAPDTGWTFYPPYSIRTASNVSLALFGVILLGFSSIFTGLNFITTIHRLRAPGMTFFRMPLFCWSLYATAWTQVLATPVLAITLLLIILERSFGIGFFDPLKGGDPILYEHLFWIYSHPAVYIMILPAMGIVTEIFPVFSGKTIFGYKAIAFSSLAIAFFGYVVWGHHMFTSGMSDLSRVLFSLITFLVAVPSGVKVFNWIATLYKGSIRLDAPLLFSLAFIFLFVIAGLTGLTIGSLSLNLYLHGTYFIVAHFHYTMFGGAGFAFFAGLHYWFPKITGRMYGERTAKAAWLVMVIGFNLTYFPMFILGMQGMPRRYFQSLPRFHTNHTLSTVGSWILAVGLIIMFGNFMQSMFRGRKAPMNPWGGTTLEWQIPSPPPAENFAKIPLIEHGPYKYD
jgi:cytochrome c oxidase subunit I